ncbi:MULTISPECIES: tyrosine-type recombinase/integrase [unclassified Streptomyces]|uniref:tyrosine-type recombinase/integrase n=1 Tax=unclassified Streptomyces TaxID=2593676 RepID=UPI00210D0694|nr:tyrosine-type recombinase/integrase [Streptomyces sp. DvalAA-14]
MRLHDLRHATATLIHAAGCDMKDIQETLGHSSIAISADTYTSLLPEFDRAIAEHAGGLIPRPSSAPQGPDRAPSLHAVPQPDAASAHASLTQKAPDDASEADNEAARRPKLQVIRGEKKSPLSDSNRRPSLYKFPRGGQLTCGDAGRWPADQPEHRLPVLVSSGRLPGPRVLNPCCQDEGWRNAGLRPRVTDRVSGVQTHNEKLLDGSAPIGGLRTTAIVVRRPHRTDGDQLLQMAG